MAHARTLGTSSPFWRAGPLSRPVFRALFIATFVSNIGTWMQEVGRAWLMTELTTSPLMVALVQSSAMAALLVFSVPAGALADIVDRRKILIYSQLWLLCTAGLLALLAADGNLNPETLLTLTFLSAAGAAFAAPAWQAALPDLVDPAELGSAITLNGVSFNVARAFGPALGGAVVAASGPTAVFVVNAVSFAAVLLALWRWRPQAKSSAVGREPWSEAVGAGLRYAMGSAAFRRVLARVALFAAPASALWALAPVISGREEGPGGYGLLLTWLGAGAVLGAAALPALRKRLGDEGAAGISSLAMALGFVGAATPETRSFAVALAGAGWLGGLTLIMVAVQASVPDWVRGRALSLFMLTFSGAMAIGSAGWGMVATASDPAAALLAAAAAQGIGAALAPLVKVRLVATETSKAAPRAWSEPELAGAPDAELGPVRVTVEYDVQPGREAQFRTIMRELGRSRRTQGTFRWSLWSDAARPSVHVEDNWIGTWGEHVRQRARGTQLDARLEAEVKDLLQPGSSPVVRHWLPGQRASPASSNQPWLSRLLERT